ncbi:MAG: T9SS type A sorting domain-containing protein [Bacteroidales bacterium]
MKEKVLFFVLILFCLTNQNVKSQNPFAIVEKATWITFYQMGAPPSEYYQLYKTGNDTLINGKNYIKLLTQSVQQVLPNTYLQLSPLCYAYAFRNDTNNRAYIIQMNDSIEHLWYDFNLNIGDTLPTNPPWFSTQFLLSGENVKVTAIDSIIYGSTYYKRFKFNNVFMNDLIKSVGFNGDLIRYNSTNFEKNISLKVFCSETSICNCNFTLIGVDENEKKAKNIFIYPNPTNSKINIDFLSSTIEVKKVIIKEITGKQIKSIDLYDNETRISIDLNISIGIYLVEIQGNNQSWTQKIIIN